MKKKIIQLIICGTLSFNASNAQNNAIFFGGNGDGWAMQSAIQSSNNVMFFGGNGDGWQQNNYVQAAGDAAYKGGNGDGWQKNNYVQASAIGVYFGGNGDGWQQNNYVQASTDAVYYGGNGDGWKQNNYAQASTDAMYFGGDGDGWATNYVPMGPLPVTFISFEARKVNTDLDALLEWEVASEINADKYIVEKSRDAVNFVAIGEVKSHGNYTGKLNYSFLDSQPYDGFNYYRLQQLDQDGLYKYTPVRMLNFNAEHGDLVLFPNPAQSTVSIRWDEQLLHQHIAINIIDMNGRVVRYQKLYDVNQISTDFNLDGLAAGQYMVHLQSDSKSFVTKLVVTK